MKLQFIVDAEAHSHRPSHSSGLAQPATPQRPLDYPEAQKPLMAHYLASRRFDYSKAYYPGVGILLVMVVEEGS